MSIDGTWILLKEKDKREKSCIIREIYMSDLSLDFCEVVKLTVEVIIGSHRLVGLE